MGWIPYRRSTRPSEKGEAAPASRGRAPSPVERDLLLFIFVLATFPFWGPVLRSMVSELWASASLSVHAPPSSAEAEGLESIVSPTERGRTRQGVWSDEGAVWTKRRIINPRWDTGQRASTPPPPDRGAGFAHRRPSERSPSAPRRRFEGGFGRRGL